jgi:DNA-binding NarL/FixJ family response regulator
MTAPERPALADETLTAREREVLQLIAAGLPNKLIAQRLRITEHTAKFHVSAILTKLGAASRTEAVTIAAHRGLLVL